jgi:hypothetical protein
VQEQKIRIKDDSEVISRDTERMEWLSVEKQRVVEGAFWS